MFASKNLNNKEKVKVFINANLSENLSVISVDSIIPFLLYLHCKLSGCSQEAFKAQTRSATLIFEAQPTTEIQDPTFNVLDPYVFMYIITNIPRNHTAHFQTYQSNKARGLVRAAGNLLIPIDVDDYVLSAAVLTHAKEFFGRHQALFSECFKTYLGFANSDGGPAFAYATELLSSVEYANMLGVKMIEENIVACNHSILSNSAVSSYMKLYDAFKRDATANWGNRWIYAAVLDHIKWRELSTKPAFTDLWILASCLAAADNQSYLGVIIKGTRVADYVHQPKYSRILRVHQEITNNIVVGGIGAYHGDNERDQILRQMEALQGWTRNGGGNSQGGSASVASSVPQNI